MSEEEVRPRFGNRKLENPENVFKHNAWDNAEWTEEQEAEALSKTKHQLVKAASDDKRMSLLEKPSSSWDKFYQVHKNKFFKDRHWLFTEFPELLHNVTPLPVPNSEDESGQGVFPGHNKKLRFMEIGCGAGNTIFPLMKVKESADFFMYGCDFAESAVEVVRTSPEFDTERCHVFVHDITSEVDYPVPENSLDIVILIFVLSAVEFTKMKSAVAKLAKLLKPGGVILFRDYGRYDLAQLRFKDGKCLEENFYHRGDGTLVYFFTQDDVKDIFTSAGLIEQQNLVDRRLQVNRARQLKMYRVWLQAKYQKPL